ncbi:LysR family transcriptional regulator [Arenivirga flava]|uniref:LysR family transcriptional regulator n=1 Tax=Arenivirga flava TaxID=1930060 RepID=UPI0024E0BFB5|nr:LysR family transcriptional regulator [Arenivirga flava]
MRLLIAFAENGTVRGVADAQRLSPSSVSQQLSLLEREVGAALLERHGRGLVLTPPGRVLVRRSREILELMDLARAEVTEGVDEPVGTVRLAAFSSALNRIVIPALRRLEKRWPRLRIEISELDPHESRPALHAGMLDLAVIADLTPAGDTSGSASGLLLNDPVVVVSAKDHPFMEHREQELRALASARWASNRPGTYLSDLLESAAARADFVPDVIGRFTSDDLLIDAVLERGVVALLPALAVPDDVPVALTRLPELPERSISLLSSRSSRSRAATRAVVDAIQERCEAISSVDIRDRR